MDTGMVVAKDRSLWRWFFGVAALEAGAAFLALALLPREGFSYSLPRAVVLAILAGCLLIASAFAFKPPRWIAHSLRPSVIFATGILTLLAGVGLFLLRYLDPQLLLAYYQRLLPLLLYILIVGVEATVFLLVVTYGLHGHMATSDQKALGPMAVTFLLLLAAFAFVAVSRLGLTPDAAYWGEPGVPLLGWQLGLAMLAGAGLLLGCLTLRMPARVDRIIAIGVWLVAVCLWLSVPTDLTRNSFYAPITPPDNQPYPNSDAGYYDSMAQSLLIGQPYQAQIPTRPLFIVVLTVLHLLAGENYNFIVAGQTLLLALIPVILYLLGRELHSRAAGLTIAAMAIFREWTTILVSSQTRVSDTRTLLVDLPTLLLVLFACLLSVRWLSRRDSRSGMLVGGSFGLLLLLRTQSLLIVPFLLAALILSVGIRSRTWLAPSLLFLAALLGSAAPWLVHNYLQTGQFTFDAPFQYQIIASQYRYTGNLDLANIDLQGKSVAALLLTFLAVDPKFVLGFIGTHFFATQIDGVVTLPLFHDYAGLSAPIDVYWLRWTGQLSPANCILLVTYLGVIAAGIGASWKRLKWAGLIPLLFSLGYALANGVGRFSGWRYDLPADWIWYFYFGIGAVQILVMFASLLGADADKLVTPLPSDSAPMLSRRSRLLLLAGFAVVGSLPWLGERLSPPRYLNQDAAPLAAQVSTSPALARAGVPSSQLASFVATPGAVVQSGRLLYPRFFSRNLGLASSHPWPAYAPRDFPRLGFLLLSQTRHDVIFPVRQLAGSFPQGSDVIVFGCARADYLEARLVYFPGLDTVYLSAPLDQACQ